MNPFKLASRELFRKGEHTTTRVISLAAGLAFGILLLSEVFYYFSYDSFYPDSKRIFLVNENFNPDKLSEELTTHPRVSGAIGPGMKAEVPGVEAATRLTSLGNSVFYSEDNQGYKGKMVLADEHLFTVLPRPMLADMGSGTLKSPMSKLCAEGKFVIKQNRLTSLIQAGLSYLFKTTIPVFFISSINGSPCSK